MQRGIPAQLALNQISKSLSKCGNYAKNFGVKIRVEVHGQNTIQFPNFRKILENSTSDNVFVCWNSNDADLLDDGFEANFDAVADKIRIVHITELWSNYPWLRLFQRLKKINFSGYCCAEIPTNPEPLRLMKYYRALFLAYQNLK
ncbi:TIM barrel protein [bacterium]|nr:TIM barrel protein [bacterium]